MKFYLLSKNNSTEAFETGFLEEDPLNTTSVIESLLKFFAELSPKTHRTASITFDLPQPLGPTIPVKPSSIKKIVLSAIIYFGLKS